MAQAGVIEADAREALKNLHFTVKVTHVREMTVRLRVATWLIRLAAWVAGFGITVNVEPGENE